MIDDPARHSPGQSLKSMSMSMSRGKQGQETEEAEKGKGGSEMGQLKNWSQETRTEKPFSMIYWI